MRMVSSLYLPNYYMRPLTKTGLTLNDVLHITPKFWNLHREPLVALDGGAFTLLSIQCNLFVGTLAPFALERPELQPILQSALDFDISWVHI